MDVDELIASTAPLIGKIGAGFYFTPETLAAGAELGLDLLQWYVIGRGGPLGDVEPPVVQAAFGYFNPTMIASAWNAARAKVPPRDAGRRHFRCAAEFGRSRFSDVDGLVPFAVAARHVVESAVPDGLPLFAAIAAEPCVDDPAGLAMQLIVVLRELRGSAHLAAVRAVGLEPKTAHFAKRPGDGRLFGWRHDDAPVVDDHVHAAMAKAERITDRIVRPAFAALGEPQRHDLVAPLAAMARALEH